MNDTARSPHEGAQFGYYLLKRLLGHGGMGDVYEAEHTVNHTTVALKVLPPVFSHDLVFCARLQRQARIMCRLDEPHIVPIHDHGEIDGQQFLDMGLINGTDLSKMLKQCGPLSAPRAVAIVRQIASALDAAHAIGVIHGDIKPRNILITPDDFAYLADWGISDAAPHKGVARVVGSAAATWKYTAPERFTSAAINHKVDIYALTCVLHECLTGSPPYWTDSAGALSSAHLSEPIPRPSQLQPAISGAFDDVIARGMAKDPLERYPSAGDLALAAYVALSAPEQDRADTILDRSQVTTGPEAKAKLPKGASAPASASGPTGHRSAESPHPESVVSQALLERPSAAESTRAAQTHSRFGQDGGGRPGDSPRPVWAAPDRQSRRLVFAVAGLLAVIVLGGVAIWLLRAVRPTLTVPGADSPGASTVSAPSPSVSQTQARLLSLLPPGYAPGVCKPISPPHGALAEMSCEANSDPDGPQSATYALYPDTISLRDSFNRITQASNIIECPGRIQSPGPWHRLATPDKPSGVLLCAIDQDNPELGWTNEAELVVGMATAKPPGPDIDHLYAWWMSHS